jgi:exodeoxyribonuclease VII small subunit
MPKGNKNKPISFEEALSRLENVVQKLEDGRLSLEGALELFAEGIKLSKICNRHLEDAEQRISILATDARDGIELRGATSFAVTGEDSGSEL